MKKECVIKSIITDLKETGILIVGVIVICMIGWLIVTYWNVVSAIFNFLNVPFVIMIIILLLMDVTCIIISMVKKSFSGVELVPFGMPLAMFGLFDGLVTSVFYYAEINKPPYVIPVAIINTILIIIIMIAVRVYIRCNKYVD